MADIFEQVVQGLGYSRTSVAGSSVVDILLSYIDSRFESLPTGGSTSFVADPDVSGAYILSGDSATLTPDPSVDGAYLIGE